MVSKILLFQKIIENILAPQQSDQQQHAELGARHQRSQTPSGEAEHCA